MLGFPQRLPDGQGVTHPNDSIGARVDSRYLGYHGRVGAIALVFLTSDRLRDGGLFPGCQQSSGASLIMRGILIEWNHVTSAMDGQYQGHTFWGVRLSALSISCRPL